MFKHIVSLSVISATLTLFSATSQAITVEEVANPRQTNGGWVTDMADILNSETEDKLNRLINNLERAEGTEIAVVTVPETAPAESPKAFATELFNHWGIGKANINNGILFLISYEENRVEIETGIGIEGILTDGEVKKIIDTQIIPQYKQNNFDRGTLDGTKALITSLDSAVVEDKTWHWSVFPLVGLGLALFTGGVISYRKRRNKIFIKPGTSRALQRIDNRAVHCAKCHQPMEKTKNIDLTLARQVAQKLGGVSYRGYRCPRCSQDSKSYSMLAYFSASNRFDDCPHCQELTVTRTGEVLEAATSQSKGKFLSRKKCHCCNYQTEQIITIPCITPTSSRNRGQNNSNTYHYYDSSGGYGGGGDSGGGFGGGSSDGGGAGGSW